MDWDFGKKNSRRVYLKDVAEIKKGIFLAEHDIHPVEQGESEYEYVVLNLRKVNMFGCVFWDSQDLVWTDKPVPKEYLTQLNDIIIPLNNRERMLIVGKKEVGYLIPDYYIVVRTDRKKLLPEYLYRIASDSRRSSDSSFCLGSEKKVFWAEFSGKECPPIGMEDYLLAELELKDKDTQSREGSVVRDRMNVRGNYYERAKQQERISRLSDMHRKWDADGLYHIEGKEYHLEVIESLRESVHLEDDKIVVSVVDATDHSRIKRMLLKWYYEYCESLAKKYVDKIYPKFANYNIPYPTIEFSEMKTVMGKCTHEENNIKFSIFLFSLSPEYIEYVVVHELAHFIHHNHKKDFWLLVEEIMPDWKQYDKNLGEELVNRRSISKNGIL